VFTIVTKPCLEFRISCHCSFVEDRNMRSRKRQNPKTYNQGHCLPSGVVISVLPEGLVFHHVGFACTDLDAEERVFSCFGYTREGPDFQDSIQGVRGRFLANGGPRLELLSELPGSAVLAPWLRRNIRMYHVAYEAADFRAANAAVAALGAKCVVAPVSAAAFAGRMISFYMLPNGFLLELIEAI
jgi:glyoxalase/bleomycin resistance protein/dioxygenase superfamily protein